jgi:hypothetical protein
MESWPMMIAGDVDYSSEATQVKLVTELGRYDFATVEKAPDGSVLIRKVPPKDLQDFEGPLFQADSDDELQAIVLRQVQLFYWPFDDDESDESEEDHEGPDATLVRKFMVEPNKWWMDFHKTFE